MIAPIGLGLLLILVGLATLFVPAIGIVGILFMIVGVLLIIAAFARGKRRVTNVSDPPKL
ncbi:MAG TPA: hypothetical protein VIJ70_10325 [Gaiellaceae bacterium]